ncbi:MAG TPA: hypothetical protein VGU61_19805 [Noviherbaspirillum sp.]|jgi:hypothetical protein|uniref:hypothetical protein n=1 Tax=Noviherbaspirillum sp. TaxID=1926288 RepID=UPI002DDCDD07|nr:hypothetical protein [Noviherbaspirillum sp.]HEV2612517.1 hypothetical protein [Noviherbaspirillum sp.]
MLEVINARGGMSLEEIIESPTRFGLAYAYHVKHALNGLEDRGFVVLKDGIFKATTEAREKLADLTPVVKAKPALVGPRVVNVFTRPIQAKYIASATGTRKEAEFWKNVPSKGGD